MLWVRLPPRARTPTNSPTPNGLSIQRRGNHLAPRPHHRTPSRTGVSAQKCAHRPPQPGTPADQRHGPTHIRPQPGIAQVKAQIDSTTPSVSPSAHTGTQDDTRGGPQWRLQTV